MSGGGGAGPVDFSRGLAGAPAQVEDLYEFALTAVLRPVPLMYHKCEEAELLNHLQDVFHINPSQHSKTIKALALPKPSSAKSKKRKISVVVVACYGLVAKEADKSSNPYVSVLYGDEEFNTPTVEHSLNPTFNEALEFEEIHDMPLMITVWSAPPAKAKGKDKEPKFLGQVAIPADEIRPAGRGEDVPFNLEKRSARSTVTGAVVVNVSYIPELPPDPIEPPAPVDRDVDHRTCHILMTRLLLDHDVARVGEVRNKSYPPHGDEGLSGEEMMTQFSPCPASMHLLELYARVYEVDSMPAKLVYLGQELEQCKDNVDADFTKLAVAMACVYKEHLSNSARLASLPRDQRNAIDAAIATVNADMAFALQQYKFRFPVVNNAVTGQLDLVIFLLMLSQTMRSATVGTRTSAAQLAGDCVAVCKKQAYKLLDAQAEATMGDNFFQRISMAADLIEDEQVQDKNSFALYFQAIDLNLHLVNANTLWTWFATSVSAALKESLGQPVRDWDELFKLYKQLKTMRTRHLQELFGKYPDTEKIFGPIHDWFKPWLLQWLAAYDERVMTYAKRATEVDKLDAISQSQLNSSSVVDILTVLSQEIDDIEDVGWPITDHLVEMYKMFADTVAHVVQVYSEWLTGHFLAWQFANSADDSRITSQLCIALNNIAQFKEGLDDTKAVVEARLGQRGLNDGDILPVLRAFTEVFSPMATALKFLIDLASKTLAPTLDQFLVFMLGTKKYKMDKPKYVLASRKSEASTGRAAVSTIVKGVDDARLKSTQKRVRQLLGKTKLMSWQKGRAPNLTVAAEEKAAYDQVRDAMDPLLAYLDSNFELFAEYLYEDVFGHLLDVLWKLVLTIGDKILDPVVQQDKAGKPLTPNQGALLQHVVNVLAKYFIADGNGLAEARVRSDQYYQLVEKLKTYSAPTVQLMWLYYETQADKIHTETTLDKPTIIYDVQFCEGTDRLHLEDRIKVIVRGATHLPALDADGGISARVVVQVQHPLMKESHVETTGIVAGSTDPVFNEKKEFQVPTVKGVLHLALYHVVKKDSQFIGEAAFSLAGLGSDQEPVECNQPLLPQLSPRAEWLLEVLGTRSDDPEASKFVQDRKSSVLGRAPGGAKVHAMAGHMFRATHKSVPPSCAVCRKVILGIGKPVYECELCGMTTHKQCHTKAAKCSRSSEA